jgi:hypothetical protein
MQEICRQAAKILASWHPSTPLSCRTSPPQGGQGKVRRPILKDRPANPSADLAWRTALRNAARRQLPAGKRGDLVHRLLPWHRRTPPGATARALPFAVPRRPNAARFRTPQPPSALLPTLRTSHQDRRRPARRQASAGSPRDTPRSSLRKRLSSIHPSLHISGCAKGCAHPGRRR